MKFILLIPALLISSLAPAQSLTPSQALDAGVAILGQEVILNPIVCTNPATDSIELIYSDDFRFSNIVYFISNKIAQKANRATIQIRELGAEGMGNFIRLQIEANQKPLVCFEASAGLE